MKLQTIKKQATALQSLVDNRALFRLIKTNAIEFSQLVKEPVYNVFKVPKKNGGARTIEDPEDNLQKAQSKLKPFLQAVYYINKTNAAYGYVLHAKDTNDTRGIITNARQHAQNSYLLNLDMKDFFHYVSWQLLYDSLTRPPFSVSHDAAVAINDLCTYKGRLPMGAPTSPALSNIAAFNFDKELEKYCGNRQITYTRFVDDMSFSGLNPITETDLKAIAEITEKASLKLNLDKTKWFGPGDDKKITGLLIKNGMVCVPDSFIRETGKEIENLKTYVLMLKRLNSHKPLEQLLKRPIEKLTGALTFIETVHGPEFGPLKALQQKLDDATLPPTDYESLHWLDIHYEF